MVQDFNIGNLRLPSTSKPEQKPTSTCYQVGKGDNLSTIAKKFGVSVKDIMAANPDIKDANKIQIGQRINLPTTKNPNVNELTGQNRSQESIFAKLNPNKETVTGLKGSIIHDPNNMLDRENTRYLMSGQYRFE